MALFSRKKNYVKREDLQSLHERLQKAFSKVKDNFSEVKGWIDQNNAKHDLMDHKIELVKLELTGLKNQLDFIQNNLLGTQGANSKESKISDEDEVDYFKELSQTQLSLLGTILKVSVISKEESIPLKIISQEYYPDYEYQSIKSVLSEYSDILLNFGLIKKQRRGRIMHVSLTEKGKKFCKKNSKKLIELSKANLKRDRPYRED